LAKVLTAPELKTKLAQEAIEPTPMSPDEFAKYIESDIARWAKLAKEKIIQLD
jgi:tripartite-type tricarboxylate transporter receptor subunit TctC